MYLNIFTRQIDAAVFMAKSRDKSTPFHGGYFDLHANGCIEWCAGDVNACRTKPALSGSITDAAVLALALIDTRQSLSSEYRAAG